MANIKEIHLFDHRNQPLTIKGIGIYLVDALTGYVIDRDTSRDLNPGRAGAPSDTWGVRLDFSPTTNPVDVFTTDANYMYPGNTVRYLNGQLDDHINLDLLALPPSPGGQSAPPASPMPSDLAKWVRQGDRWSDDQKAAVMNLMFNYFSVILPHLDEIKEPELVKVAENWEQALTRLHILPDFLKKSSVVVKEIEVAKA